MNERWSWLARYAIVVIVALVLGAALGAMDLFKETRVINRGLTASYLVRFLGYGGALAVLWLAAYVVGSGHGVLLLVLDPLMDRALHQIYDWLFIIGIIGSAAWLLVALFNESALLSGLATGASRQLEQSDPVAAKCASCGTPVPVNARYCNQCGAAV